MQSNNIANLIDGFLKNIDWQKHYNNLEVWIKDNASAIGEKLGVTKEWIVENSQELTKECINLFQELRSDFSIGLSEIKSEWKSCIDEINSTFEKPEHLIKINEDFLNMAKLSKVIRDNIVPGSNGVAVFMKKTDNRYIFYICYLKDNVILPNAENNHIIILSESIARDVEQHFEKSPIIILK